jgi:hypothetical protein
MFKKVWGRRWGMRLGSDIPKRGMNKKVPQTIDPAPFGGRFGGRALEMLFRYHNWYMIQGLGVEIFRFSEIRQLHLIRPR